MPTILVIDDEEEIRLLARMVLDQHGYTVMDEGDAQAGIAAARRQRPDLILMDVSMPMLDGWTAMHVLKSDPSLAHVPIVAWTALDIGGEAGARAAGYDGYLPKPVNLARFVDQIAALLAAQPEKPPPPPVAVQAPGVLPARPRAAAALVEARLLLLADDPVFRQDMYRWLSSQGYHHILEAPQVAGALQTAGAQDFDLVLLDLDTRAADGFDVLRRLRGEIRLETTPIIVVTGIHTARTDAVRGLDLGADDYVLKPINWDELGARVSNRLRIKLLEDSLRRQQGSMQVLYHASQLLSASLDPATVLALILEQAAASVEAIQGGLYLLNASCRPVRQFHTSGVPDLPWEKLKSVFERGLADWACRLLEPVVVENTPAKPHDLRRDGDRHTRTSLIIPLVGREGVLGLLVLDHDEPGHFTRQHVEWLRALIAQAAVALENARLFEQVRNERKKLAAILDSSADAIVVMDDAKRIALINAAAGQVLGLHTRAIGHSIDQALPDHPLPKLLDFAALRGEPVNLEVDVSGKAYHATVRPVPGVGYVAALHDIHLLKEIEKLELERERQETERVRREFARHVSPMVAELLLKRGETLGALRKCQAAMLFSDLRNYTALTERIGIEAVVEYVLKRYITVMTDMIYAHEGTINKILGDGIMAVFGVPIAQPNAPQRAVRTAVSMQRALLALREGWLRELGQDIGMGIGLAWGEVIAGDITGSSQRGDYTVIGDAVNVASRLGEMAAPGEVLLTQVLADAVGGDSPEWKLEELPPAMIKGKERPQRICRAIPTWSAP